ncbi:hypothetical protein Ddc_22487 [Ditylenchus destructor]|nr:hypothetical protein Ddc_22487 [Ditylenchus destructor]
MVARDARDRSWVGREALRRGHRPIEGGQATVRQAIPPSTVASLFGPATGKGMMFMVGQTIIDLKRQLDEFVPVEALEPAFGGFQLGAMKDCIARDANEVFDIAMRLSTAFSLSTFGVEAPTADREAQRAFDEWAEKVKDQVLAMGTREALAQAFNVAVPLAGKKRLRVGFVLGGYVAQFGVLRIGRSMSADQRALKLKLSIWKRFVANERSPFRTLNSSWACRPQAIATHRDSVRPWLRPGTSSCARLRLAASRPSATTPPGRPVNTFDSWPPERPSSPQGDPLRTPISATILPLARHADCRPRRPS